MNYRLVCENNDIKRIDKLNKLTNVGTFFDDVRKFTKNVTSDHAINRWQCLADARYNELITGVENVRFTVEFDDSGKFISRYFSPEGEEVFPIVQ